MQNGIDFGIWKLLTKRVLKFRRFFPLRNFLAKLKLTIKITNQKFLTYAKENKEKY